MRDYKHYHYHEEAGLAQVVAWILIVLFVAFMGYAGARELDQSRTILKLSETCSTAQQVDAHQMAEREDNRVDGGAL